MSIAQLFNANKPESVSAHFRPARLIAEAQSNCWVLDDGQIAKRATGCILRPRLGDQVLVCGLSNGEAFISQILTREEQLPAYLDVPQAKETHLAGQDIHLLAERELNLSSLSDLNCTALEGRLSLQAEDMMVAVRNSLVETIRDRVSNVYQWMMDARSMFRFHGANAVITADKDIRVDAERINMG